MNALRRADGGITGIYAGSPAPAEPVRPGGLTVPERKAGSVEDSRRRLWLGMLWFGLGLTALPGLGVALPLLRGQTSHLSRLLTTFLLAFPPLTVLAGLGFMLPATRWKRATELLGQALLISLLLLGILNCMLSAPLVAQQAQRGVEAIPALFSWFLNNVLFFWLWREAMSVCGARVQRNCPWRLTVLASLCLAIPALTGALSPPSGGPSLQLSFGQDGAAFFGFPGWLNWNYCVGFSALLTLLAASRHRSETVPLTRWLALCCLWLLLPVWLMVHQGTLPPSALHPLLAFLPLILGLTGLFSWLSSELAARTHA